MTDIWNIKNAFTTAVTKLRDITISDIHSDSPMRLNVLQLLQQSAVDLYSIKYEYDPGRDLIPDLALAYEYQLEKDEHVLEKLLQNPCGDFKIRTSETSSRIPPSD
ncbi:hypothetical protein H2200_001115 [Cladophialophora chaetospira]|uniref:Uncharacterized protein n=1 Tax=Cladophialophora chaetospira TaxID=386627 RepID=A0AA39CNR1_9EURO|nr:hypothetical protein H2200_001115 [Cladophialophora chaetospira]